MRVQREPVVGFRAAQCQRGFEHVPAGEVGPGPAGVASRDKTAPVANLFRTRAKRIGIEGEHALRARELRDRSKRTSISEPRAIARHIVVHRFVSMPDRLRKLLQQLIDLARKRRRRDATGQQAQSPALLSGQPFELGQERCEEHLPSGDPAIAQYRARPIRSSSDSTAASANRSVAPRLAGCSGLPSILIGRTSTDREHPPRVARKRQACRKTQRLAGHDLLRHAHIGYDLFVRLAAACECHSHLRREEPQRLAPGQGIRRYDRGRWLAQRWHVEQSVSVVELM